MISNEIFVLLLGALLASLVLWAFKRLPDERWQFLASVPIVKDANGHWHGLNFTYYGLLTANALVFGVTLLIVFFGSLHIATSLTLTVIFVVLIVCLPAARWVARLVEGKSSSFTIAGAFFVGIFVAPLVLGLLNYYLTLAGYPTLPIVAALAAVMIAYAFGEGLGRLACISFGCCYGVALLQAPPILKRVFDHWHFVFSGNMKKISYASGLAGKQVIPIQAITCSLYTCAGLAATLLFLNSHFTQAFILSMVVTQGWRILSEVLRADNRGYGRVSTYQLMGLMAICYSLTLLAMLPAAPSVSPRLDLGLAALWHPEIVLFLQTLWIMVFVFFGKSMVTGAKISFHLHEDRI
jgi:hypothetical protein